jgi:uncharacterized protein YegP (UPF0339 family)
VSNFFRDLGGQGASSSRKNTEWWVDWGESEQGKALLEKEKAGTLAKNEKPMVDAYRSYQSKAAKEGIESTKKVSASTGVPDLTDKAAQARKMSQALSGISGRGRRQSMMNGEYDDSMLGGF